MITNELIHESNHLQKPSSIRTSKNQMKNSGPPAPHQKKQELEGQIV